MLFFLRENVHALAFLNSETVFVNSQRIEPSNAHLLLRSVLIAATVVAFMQISLGGFVRISGSGLGCPDWPLCHGELIPPFEFSTIIEYSHRLTATLLGTLVLLSTVLAWPLRRQVNRLFGTLLCALVLVLLAAVLGGVTVLTELAWWGVLVHLSIAESLIACLILAWFDAQRSLKSGIASNEPTAQTTGLDRSIPGYFTLKMLSLSAVAGVFILILSGSYMVGYGAGSSCATWPLCRGDLWPNSPAYSIHMLHRYIAAVIGILLVCLAYKAWAHRDQVPGLRVWSAIMLALMSLQIVIGAITVWSMFSPMMKSIHLGLATFVWMTLIYITALIYAKPMHQETSA